MKLSVIGCGYLGAVHAAAMAHLGHDVIGIDVDPTRLAALEQGQAPFFEPGLPELLANGVASGRLRFSNSMADAADADVHFVAVGTPQQADSNAADMRFVDSAFRDLLPYLAPGAVVVGKSTVPVGTAARLAPLVADTGATLVWNPEFLREGYAVKDTLTPDRLVYGVESGDEYAVETLDDVYRAIIDTEIPRVVTDYATAELVKTAANAFLATKISFINAMAEIAEVVGADVVQLADAIGHDVRIGRRFLGAGIGFGGGCLPKDIRAFVARAEELGTGQSVRFLQEVDAINLRRRERVATLAADVLGGSVAGRRIAMLGLSFKPFSDDVRDSPALAVARALIDAGADVIAIDPEAIPNAQRIVPDLVTTTELSKALAGAELVILTTEWPEFRGLDPRDVLTKVAHPNIIDARNAVSPQAWIDAGWTYRGLGRH